jgi:hypothetical protein
MKGMTNEEYVAHLRRLSSGFSRGASNFRGVTKHHQHGRWEARIGRVMGNKYLVRGPPLVPHVTIRIENSAFPARERERGQCGSTI